MRWVTITSLVFVLGVICGPSAWSQSQGSSRAAQGGMGAPIGYQIGPKDVIRISVAEISDLDVTRRVSDNGTVSLPLIGDFNVGGLTTVQAADHLKRLLEAKYVQRATVDIEITEFRSKPISVIGAVRNPGPLAFPGHWTLMEALTAAGGLSSNHGGVIYVLRRADNGLSDRLTIPINDLMIRGEAKDNIPIFANDLINVPSDVSVTIYCLGEVKQPGALAFKMSERVTLLAAIARAGGLTDRASDKIVIRRHGRDGEKDREIKADYGRIIKGQAPDVPLRDGDVLVVKESFF